jgi:hypothetical protein
MFERIISVDWSGAGTETMGVDLRVTMFDAATGHSRIINRIYGKREVHSWTRSACRDWLKDRLRESPPTLVACDFGFGFPYGTDTKVFGVDGWKNAVTKLGRMYSTHGTARATAHSINGLDRFDGHGPYRFDESRTDFRFYLDHSVGYYRLTELLSPQAISQWYLGSGGTVGFHSISGLAAIADLIELREKGEVNFEVWPQESRTPSGDKHVLVESYPSICPELDDYDDCRDDHQRDAWKVLQFLVAARADQSLGEMFEIKEQPCGRIDGVSFDTQIEFEGFILGLK